MPAIYNLIAGRDFLDFPLVAWAYLALILVMLIVSIAVRRVAWKTMALGLGVFLFFVPFLMAYGPTAMGKPFLYYLPFATAWYLALYAIPHLLGVGLGTLTRLIVQKVRLIAN